MKKISGKLTVFFENPFWVGIFENIENDNLSVCKVTFGSEPKEYEIYDFILERFDTLKFSNEMKSNFNEKVKNPKRRQKELQSKKFLKKSEEILKLQYEENKKERKIKTKKEKELEKQRKFLLKQEKKKQKHKGK